MSNVGMLSSEDTVFGSLGQFVESFDIICEEILGFTSSPSNGFSEAS